MTPRRDPAPRAREAPTWLGGILLVGILGAGVVAAAMLLWENIDVQELVPALASEPEPSPLPVLPSPAVAGGGSFTAAVFNAPRNSEFFPDSLFHSQALEMWSGLIRRAGGQVREVGDAAGIRAMAPDELLVLVESPCLSRDERRAVTRHLAGGGSVVANWAVGARDQACEWIGWNMVAELTGAEDVREIQQREALFLTVPGGLPLSPGLDPGTRIEFFPGPSLALRLSGPKVYWSDWAMNPAPDESGGGADVAASVNWTGAGGRAAWFGIRHGTAATSRDSLLVDRMLLNGVTWAAGRPLVTPATWPGGQRSAVMMTLDVESQPGNARGVAATMQDEGIPGTFFAVSRLVQEDRELGAVLAAAGEVATQTPDHAPIDGLAPAEQLVRLRHAVREIQEWSGETPVGLRPPEEAFDAATLRAWSQVGGRYVMGLNDSRSGSPEVHAVPGENGTVIVLPRVVKDDYNVFVQEGALRGNRLSQAYLDGLRKLRALGGLAVLSGHTQILNSRARLEALRTVADSIRIQGDWWMATGADVAAWWQGRHEVEVTMDLPGATGDSLAVLSARVRAPAGEGLTDLWLELFLTEQRDGWVPLVDGESVEYDATPWGIRLPVGPLAPGQERIITLREEEGEGEGEEG